MCCHFIHLYVFITLSSYSSYKNEIYIVLLLFFFFFFFFFLFLEIIPSIARTQEHVSFEVCLRQHQTVGVYCTIAKFKRF